MWYQVIATPQYMEWNSWTQKIQQTSQNRSATLNIVYVERKKTNDSPAGTTCGILKSGKVTNIFKTFSEAENCTRFKQTQRKYT